METAGKILFLDIDGVLNHANYGQPLYFGKFSAGQIPLDDDNTEQLKRLLNADSSLKIVWSTDWKHCTEAEWRGFKNPRLELEKQAFMQNRIAGSTPSKMSSEHFHEIHWWLKSHQNISDYVILEDSYFPDDWFGLEKHLVRVNSETGLTADNVDEAIRILKIK